MGDLKSVRYFLKIAFGAHAFKQSTGGKGRPSWGHLLGEAWDHERMLKKKEPAFPAIRRGSMISTTSMRPFIGPPARFLRN